MAKEDDDLVGPLDLPGEPETSRVPNYPKKKSRKPSKKIVWGVVGLIVLAGIGLVVWAFLKKPAKSSNTAASQAKTSTSSSSTGDIPDESTLKKYTNDILGFSLSYPNTWALTATTDGGVRIESPQFDYKTTVGESVNGYFRLYIRQQARAVDSKYIGRAVAIAPSQTLTYSHPIGDQRKSTLFTNFGLDTPDNFAFLMVAGNFQLNKGDTLGPNYGKEPGTFIIAGGYSSKDLTDDLATHQVPTNWYAHTNAYKQAIDIIKSLQVQ